jgi:hypothetical protein
MITLERAKKLQIGEILVDSQGKRWKVNGRVKTWKTRPEQVRVPVKHGLYSHDYITEHELSIVTLED